jgi:hypothetical protein
MGVFSLWLLVPCMNLPEARVESYLAYLKRDFSFCEKMGPFFGGSTPVVAPEGDLVFGGKPSHPLTLFNDEIYICTANYGVGYVKKRRNLEILSKGRSDVAVGYSKRW